MFLELTASLVLSPRKEKRSSASSVSGDRWHLTIVPHWTFGAPIKTVASLLIYNRNECEWSWPYVVGMKQTARGTCLSHFFCVFVVLAGESNILLNTYRKRRDIFFLAAVLIPFWRKDTLTTLYYTAEFGHLNRHTSTVFDLDNQSVAFSST